MSRDDKVEAVAQIAEHFRSSTATVLTEYRGLTVAQLKTLRRSLGEGAHYAVVKNTLTKIAAKNAGVEGLDGLLVGPSALAFIKGDPVEAAKGLRDFAKANPKLVIKGGYMDGKALSTAEITRLADLESREVLLAKLAGAMKAKTAQAAALFQAPLSKAARTIEALRQKAESDPSVIGGAGTPAVPEAVSNDNLATDTAPAATDAPASEPDATFAEDAAPATAEAPEASTDETPAAVDVTDEQDLPG
ncbi:MAG: 50S ribosomal protein L10 [Candidatus Nanopelagicales bacterium]